MRRLFLGNLLQITLGSTPQKQLNFKDSVAI